MQKSTHRSASREKYEVIKNSLTLSQISDFSGLQNSDNSRFVGTLLMLFIHVHCCWSIPLYLTTYMSCNTFTKLAANAAGLVLTVHIVIVHPSAVSFPK